MPFFDFFLLVHLTLLVILDLVKRIVTVSVETVAIVNALPSLRIQEQAAIPAEVVNVG